MSQYKIIINKENDGNINMSIILKIDNNQFIIIYQLSHTQYQIFNNTLNINKTPLLLFT